MFELISLTILHDCNNGAYKCVMRIGPSDYTECVYLYSEGQSAAIPVASMEFAAICLRNALLLLPEHQQQDMKTENGSKSSSQSGSTESGSENSDACRSDTHTHLTYLLSMRTVQ